MIKHLAFNLYLIFDSIELLKRDNIRWVDIKPINVNNMPVLKSDDYQKYYLCYNGFIHYVLGAHYYSKITLENKIKC